MSALANTVNYSRTSVAPVAKPKFVLSDALVATLVTSGKTGIKSTTPPAAPISHSETVAPKIQADAGCNLTVDSDATQGLVNQVGCVVGGASVVSNTDFSAAIFRSVPEGASALVCSKAGDPTTGPWVAKPATQVETACSAYLNNYFNCASVRPNADGTFSARKDNAEAYHCLVLDDIGTKVALALLRDFKASWVLETSPGNFQVGYILAVPLTNAAEVTQLQNLVIEAGLCDPGANGMMRWMRLPNGINGKEKYRSASGQPFQCVLKKWRPEVRYTVDDIIAGLKLEMAPVKAPVQHVAKDTFVAKAITVTPAGADDQNKTTQAVMNGAVQVPVIVPLDTSSDGPPDLIMLASALACLTPDCDDYTWKFYRLAPLARIAREYPALAAEVYALAKSWSSGALGDKPSKAWVTPGASDGLTGAVAFEAQWKRFLQPNPSGKQTSVGTIYHHAKEAGWIRDALIKHEKNCTAKPLDKPAALAAVKTQSHVVKLNETQTALAVMQEEFGLLNMSGKLCVFDRISLATHTDEGAAQRLVLSPRADGALLIRRALKAKFPLAKDKAVLEDFWVSPQTICYTGVDFNPTGTSADYLNLWVGPTVIAKAGCWPLIKTFLLDVICAGNEGHYEYLLKYLAHALQHPEEKPGVMIILIGGQGIGKGSLARILQKIWRATFLQVNNVDAVTGSFNAALERTFMVFMDEALFAGDRRASDALKSLVTEPVIHINEKHQPSRQIHSYHRFFAATNAAHLKNTDRDDRRDFALRVSEARKGDKAYWQALYHEINNGGVEAMAHDLQAMDLSAFNVRSKPDTAELLEQKLQSLDPIPRWWYGCLNDGELGTEGTWPDFVATEAVICGVMEINGGKMYRKPSAIDVVKAMKSLCPSAVVGQQQTDLGRRRGLELPPLEQARAEFDQYIGAGVQW